MKYLLGYQVDMRGFERKEGPSRGREGGGSWRSGGGWSGRERWGLLVKEREALGECRGDDEKSREGGSMDLGAGNLIESLGKE